MKQNNLLLLLGAVALTALAGMGYAIYYQNQILENLDRQTLMLSKQSSSDSVESIEKDLSDTDLDDLDNELDDIGGELENFN